MSALRSKADIGQRGFNVRFVPKADIRWIGSINLTRVWDAGPEHGGEAVSHDLASL